MKYDNICISTELHRQEKIVRAKEAKESIT